MKTRILVAAIATALASAPAFATNGYFAHGFGGKSKGMAGAGSVYSKEALVGATNPASISLVGNRADLGVELFMPDRTADVSIDNTGDGVADIVGNYNGNHEDMFLMPDFGYSKRLNDKVTAAFLVYGNGGMNTRYNCGLYSSAGLAACAGTDTGVDLAQMFISPTIAWDLNERNSIGVGLNIAYQRFKAYGLSDFGFFSPSGSGATYISDQSYDYSAGVGARIGWTGKVSDNLTLGASYTSRTYMEKFDKYRELFPEQGGFDIPSNWDLGLAFQATPKLAIAVDVQGMNYSEINSVSNPNNLTSGGVLGADNGPGFGYDDMIVFKLGFDYKASNSLVLRAGLSHTDQPVGSNDTNFDVLAPAVIDDHATIGFTYTLAGGNEITGFYMHAFENSVNGDNSASANQIDKLTMSQDSVGLTYTWKLN